MSDTLSRWIRSYRKQSSKRHLQKSDADLQNVITPDNERVFESSESSLLAVKLIGLACNNQLKTVSQTDFVLIRHYLICQIAISNANRAGVIANMTVDEFRQAKLKADHGNFVVSVSEHKTSHHYGLAKVVLSEMLYNWLKVYLIQLRRRVMEVSNSTDTGFLLVSYNGIQLASSQVSTCLQSVWAKAGLNQRITCTLIRKTAVSEVHENAPELKSKLVGWMCHSVNTADLSYRLADRERSSLMAAQHLTSAMRSSKLREQVITPLSESNVILDSEIVEAPSTRIVWMLS